MNIACPECTTIYRVDPSRVPAGGVTARCSECETLFRVEPDSAQVGAGDFITAQRVEEAIPLDSPNTPAPEPAETARAPEPAEAAPGQEPGAGPEPALSSSPDVAAEPHPEPAEVETPEEDEGTEAGGEAAPGGARPAFGPQDPETRARRLARALVSDIKVYHPDRWQESAEAGTLRSDFRDEILKSWEEYVEQVGEEMAKKTPYFRDALNEILAQGARVF